MSSSKLDDLLTPELRETIGKALQKQNQIDRDAAGPKADFESLTHDGVVLSSRWDILHEYEHMKKIVDLLPIETRTVVASIFCDSNGCAFYHFSIDTKYSTAMTPWEIYDACKKAGGFNGIYIQAETGSLPQGYEDYFDPWWGEIDEEQMISDGDPNESGDEEIKF